MKNTRISPAGHQKPPDLGGSSEPTATDFLSLTPVCARENIWALLILILGDGAVGLGAKDAEGRRTGHEVHERDG